MTRYLIVFLMILTPVSAFAQKAVPPEAERPRTEIVVDETANVIRFVISGREVARLDHTGLHVEGDIDFAGQIKDVGSQAEREGATP